MQTSGIHGRIQVQL